MAPEPNVGPTWPAGLRASPARAFRLPESLGMAAVPDAFGLVRLALAVAIGAATGWFVAWHQNAPGGIHQVGIVAAAVPLMAWIATVVAAVSVLRPWLGLVLYVAVAPLIQVAQPGMSVGDFQVIVPAVMVGAVAIGTVVGRVQRLVGSPTSPAADEAAVPSGRRLLRALPPVALMPVALLAITCVSIVRSASVSLALPVGFNGVIVPIVAGWLIFELRPTTRQLWMLVGAIGIAAALGSAINIYEMLASGLDNFQANRIYLARLTYYNVGMFGQVLAASVPLLVATVLGARVGLRRPVGWLLIGALAVAVGGIVFTFSKSAWLGSEIALGTLGLSVAASKRARLGVVVGLLAVTMIIVPYPAQLVAQVYPPLGDAAQGFIASVQGSDRYNSWDPGTSQGEVSITERYYATGAAARMALDNPLVGIGPNQFAAAYASPQYRPAESTRALDSAHNFLAEIAAELGLIALAIVVALLLLAFRAAWLAFRRTSGTTRLLSAALLAGLVGWIVAAETFDVDLYRTWRLMNFDILLGALLIGAALALPNALRTAARAAEDGALPADRELPADSAPAPGA